MPRTIPVSPAAAAGAPTPNTFSVYPPSRIPLPDGNGTLANATPFYFVRDHGPTTLTTSEGNNLTIGGSGNADVDIFSLSMVVGDQLHVHINSRTFLCSMHACGCSIPRAMN